ncbi:thioredoxin fold domain-containing protein [Pantoea dispersa]|uniref:thioredoxin fold domain-containing protein n=1 Tax=Pantoea dispersa TaxID=59814 RepID=UPI001CA61AB2|nr:thioredoxin fold domain-containing protein [Pantoea dispersa]QZY97789.1 thioredoxin fold domain-containing protein [Pantoea dispersa]
MTISRREGPFVAEINGDLLSARRETPEEGHGMNGAVFLTRAVSAPLFALPLKERPWFVMHGDGLYAQNARDALAPLYRGDDSGQLLCCITDLLTIAESKRLRGRKLRKFGYALAVAALTAGWLTTVVMASRLFTPENPQMLTKVDTRTVFHSADGPVRYATAEPGVRTVMPNRTHEPQPGRAVVQQSTQPQPPAAAAPADGWDLPLNVRAELPAKLRSAASRALFTVPLSSGHARTLYVFADPACPNCRRMERHYETAAGMVNVVIFPVTIEGREASLQKLTPVMMLPEDQRAAAWKQLFAADAGMGVPGAVPRAPDAADDAQAETARGAVGVNEVAFRAYRLPGTPWTISDDGRYVPQGVLSSPAALTDFLNGGGHDRQ